MSLDNQIKNFEKAKNGSELKSSLILLLEALLADSGYNAGNLSGYLADEFVTKEKLQAEAESINDAIDYIMKTQAEGATIYSRLSSVSEIKEQIRLAVNDIYGSAKIPTTGEGAAFEEYVTAILEIPDEVDVKVLTTVTAEENGTYEPEEGKAFGTVLVSVPQQTLTTRVITKNGTYYAEQDGADGYEYVQVAVTGSADSYTVRFMSADGQNVLYTARNIPYGGYAVFGGEYPTSSEPDEYFTGWNPTPENITQDTDCYPVFGDIPTGFDYEIPDTWEQIVANHGSGYPIGAYKFLSFDQDKILEYQLTKPTYTYNSTNRNYRAIVATQIKGIYPLKMRKIATGEGGSGSTWVAENPIIGSQYRYQTGYSSVQNPTEPDGIIDGTWSSSYRMPLALNLFFYYKNGKNYDVWPTTSFAGVNDGTILWGVSDAREFLNDDFKSILPEVLQNGIMSVPKNSSGIRISDGTILSENVTRDKIWIPGVKEFCGNDSLVFSQDQSSTSSSDALKKTFKQISSNAIMNYSQAWFTGNIINPFSDSVEASEVRPYVCENSDYANVLLRDMVHCSGSIAYCSAITLVKNLNAQNVTYLQEYSTTYQPIESSGHSIIIGFCL